MAATVLAGLLLALVSVACGDEGVTRELNVTREWDTSCMAQLNNRSACDAHPLAHVVATARRDTLHVLVSLWAAPSCLLLRTEPDAQLDIDWAALLGGAPAGAITAGGVLAAYGVSLDQLIEFDDPSDTGDLTRAAAAALRPFSLDVTSGQLDVAASAGTVTVRLTAPPSNASDWSATGSLSFRVEVLNSERRTDQLPHLQQTGNSAVAGLVLEKLNTSSGFDHTRFGVQVTTMGSETQKLEETKSLDDEYTPGVFKLVSLSSSAADAGYLQWRPVAYTASEFSIEHSTTARHYSLQPAGPAASSPLLRAYFGDQAAAQRLNVTFGLSEDGWYKEAEFAAWDLTAGLGAPPTDQFSLMVILLLGIGLGLPALALVGGGVWMLVRRVRGRTADGGRLLAEEE